MNVALTRQDLERIQARAAADGYAVAVSVELGLPLPADLQKLRQQALAYFLSESTGAQHGYVVERAWLRAYEATIPGLVFSFSFSEDPANFTSSKPLT